MPETLNSFGGAGEEELGCGASRGPSGFLAPQQATVRWGALRTQQRWLLPGNWGEVGATELQTAAYSQDVPPNTT